MNINMNSPLAEIRVSLKEQEADLVGRLSAGQSFRERVTCSQELYRIRVLLVEIEDMVGKDEAAASVIASREVRTPRKAMQVSWAALVGLLAH